MDARKLRCIRAGLRGACEDLSSRGLYLASKWSAEQLFGMLPEIEEGGGSSGNGNASKGYYSEEEGLENEDEADDEEEETADAAAAPHAQVQHMSRWERDHIHLGQSLILNGEYLRCAHMLRKQGGDTVTSSSDSALTYSTSSTVKVKSRHGLFLANYSLYLAGEKLKDQQQVEKEGKDERLAQQNSQQANPNARAGGGPAKGANSSLPELAAKNPFLGDIFRELWPLYEETMTQLAQTRSAASNPSPNPVASNSTPTRASTRRAKAAAAATAAAPVSSAGQGSDATLDGFLLYLLGVVVRDLETQAGGVLMSLKQSLSGAGADKTFPTAFDLFVLSVRLYPWNWSCWLELAVLCSAAQRAPPQWEHVYQEMDHMSVAPAVRPHGSSTSTRRARTRSDSASSMHSGTSTSDAAFNSNTTELTESCHWIMYQHFLVEYHLEQQNSEGAFGSIEVLSEWTPRSHTLVTYRALAFFCKRDYDNAQETFELARSMDPHQLAHLGTFSSILHVNEKRAELSHLAHVVTKIDKYSPETCCVVGNYYSLKGKHERAITYFQRALRANAKFLSAWTLMGHECLELRNIAAAVQCYRNAVDLNPGDYRPWYGLGQTYEMLHLYQYALYYYRKVTALKPNDARMWSAVGACLVRLGSRHDAMLTFERAVGCGDSEGVATRELARLYRDEGKSQEAARCYLRYFNSGNDNHLVHAALDAAARVDAGKADADVSVTASSSIMMSGGAASATRQQNSQSKSISGIDLGAAFASGTANGMTPLDPQSVEGALYLANYYRNIGEYTASEAFCALIIDFVGPEGDEARAIVRDIRSLFVQQQTHASFANSTAQASRLATPSRDFGFGRGGGVGHRTPGSVGVMSTSSILGADTPSQDDGDLAGHLSMSSDGSMNYGNL